MMFRLTPKGEKRNDGVGNETCKETIDEFDDLSFR